MSNIAEILHKAGWDYEAAVVLAECFEYDHPTVRIKEESEQEKSENDVERV